MSDIVEFPWRPGMRLFLPERADDRMARVIRVEHGLTYTLLTWALESAVGQNPMAIGSRYGHECRPDLDDAATKGALAGAVRELYPEWFAISCQYRGSCEAWNVVARRQAYRDRNEHRILGEGATEPEAWLAAYHAAKGGSNG